MATRKKAPKPSKNAGETVVDDSYAQPAEWFAAHLDLGASELTRLVRAGVIGKATRGKYAVLPTVRRILAHQAKQVPSSAAEALDREGKQSELAAILGVSAPTVSRYFSDGMVNRGQTLLKWIQTIAADQRDKAAGRDGDDNVKLAQARTREALAKAEAQELANLRELGILCITEDAENLLTEWALEVQRIVMGALDRASEHIESKFGVTLEPADLEQFGRNALESAGHRAEQLAESLGEGGAADRPGENP